MTEERTRAAQFFHFYKPCVEQELTIVSEIEHLQSILEETTKQCNNPVDLPAMSEDLIAGYKIPEYLLLGSREPSTSMVRLNHSTRIFLLFSSRYYYK